MKKKIMITILSFAVMSFVIGTVILAFNEEPTVMNRIKKFNEMQVIEDISNSNIQHIREKNIGNIENQENVKRYMKNNQLIENDESDLKIQSVINNITNEKYYRFISKGAIIDVLQDNGELSSYINAKPTNYIKGTTYNRQKVENVAKEIMATNQLLNVNKNYKFVEIKEKTTYYPTAWFKDSKNNKLMYISFNPDNKEIIYVGTKAIPISENNEIKIDEATAKKIAKDIVGKKEEEIITIEQTEVIPNQMFLESGYYYSELNIKRNAYVITFDTISKLQVFVDATTGEVIGGDGVW